MKSFTRMRGRGFWLVCALCVLLPGIAAGSSSSVTDFSDARGAGAQAGLKIGLYEMQAGLTTRRYEAQAGPKTRLYATHAGTKTRRYAETATGHRHVDSADADSESGDRVTPCALLAGLHISQRAPRLEDFGSRIDSGTRPSCRLAFGPRFAPRPPPAPRQL